jgi:hypothetical protein
MTGMFSGPPGPDPDEDELGETEESEALIAEDNYKRRNSAAPLATAINDMFGSVVLDATQYTDAWWSEREQAQANERARDVARSERDRMRHRAEMLVQTEGQGLRGRFPRWAVEGAQKVHLDTPAMKHGRMFASAPDRAFAASTDRLLGERDGDEAPPRDPPTILVLAGGTGAGKTTVAAWIALKSYDAFPGFIQAGELESRGRYDKDLRGWLPERTSLVIDDIGAELLDGKGVFRSFLDEIVDRFYSSKRRLVITTNLRPKIDDAYRADCARDGIEPEPQFRERYGDRVRSRIIQVGQWADCGNTDLRVSL